MNKLLVTNSAERDVMEKVLRVANIFARINKIKGTVFLDNLGNIVTSDMTEEQNAILRTYALGALTALSF